MKIENVKLIDDWLVVSDDPNCQWAFLFCTCGLNSHKTPTDALNLHRQFQLSQLERLSEKDAILDSYYGSKFCGGCKEENCVCDSPNTPTKGSEVSRNVSSAM